MGMFRFCLRYRQLSKARVSFPEWLQKTNVSSCGFWPGGGPIPYAAFYSYTYPMPAGFPEAQVQPDDAFYSVELSEFILPYDAVRLAADPDATLLAFLQSTYDAAAGLAGWDRDALEYAPNFQPPSSE